MASAEELTTKSFPEIGIELLAGKVLQNGPEGSGWRVMCSNPAGYMHLKRHESCYDNLDEEIQFQERYGEKYEEHLIKPVVKRLAGKASIQTRGINSAGSLSNEIIYLLPPSKRGQGVVRISVDIHGPLTDQEAQRIFQSIRLLPS